MATAVKSVVYVDAHPRRDASGIVWDEHHIVTVDHAIEREDEIDVLLADGATARASLVGRDATTDVALLHTDTTLVPARRADSKDLGVGTIVLAVGRDEDGAPGASFGVVSSLDGPWRTWRGGDVDRFIRPDLNLYPSFSGGPLVDVTGAVVGMNTWGLSRRMALTLPLATIERVVAQLQSGGKIARGYLGIAMQEVRLPESLRRRHEIAQRSGAIVVDVAPEGPADKAGVLIGDVLLELGGKTVEDSDDVAAALGAAAIGTQQPLRILRGGEARTVTVTVGERASDDE
ncbi:MAG: serine protease [Candidatus Eremiobacteraeota bacterium]|nr:serine protease [Candidatus Eremiobacteraeota bacterium]